MKYEFRGKTPKDAIKHGLKKLSLREDEVNITILEEGSAGLFRLGGKQRAIVLIEPKNGIKTLTRYNYITLQKQIKKVLSRILELAKIPFDRINTTVMTGRIMINIVNQSSPHQDITEEFIFSLSDILHSIINKDSRIKVKCNLDYNFMIKNLEENIIEEVRQIAATVKETGKPQRYPRPLGLTLRKVVHDAVRDIPGVTSRSITEGEEKIVEIIPKLNYRSQ